MTNLESIATLAPDALRKLLKEAEPKIAAALISAAEEAQAQGGKAKLRITYAITINMDANALEYALGLSTPYKLTATDTIPDPNQVPLPLEEQ